MTSLWHSTRASLDDCLTLPRKSLGKLQAGQSVDVAEVIAELAMAAESARFLGALVSAELPEASWQNRRELDALIEEIQKNLETKALEELRSRLLALATELERGSIVHRRALRVSELNQLRDLAIKELRSQAGPEGAPQTLPGPEAEQWVEWVCNLKEPEDAEALQTLRNGFAHLDDFVANLEPGMWVVETAQARRQKREELEELQKSLEAQAEQLRSRLWDLAAELERGSIVHHRAFRVNQLNQLREQAIDELRSQAVAEGAPQTLPGPEAGEWVKWVCGLKEPEDAEPLQILRDGFAHLDDFVANLEPDMWRAAGRPTSEFTPESKILREPEILPAPERSADMAQQEPFRPEPNGVEEPIVTSTALPSGLEAAESSAERDEPRAPHSLDEPSLSAIEWDTLTPNDVTPPQAEEEVEPVPAEKRVQPAGTKGFVTHQVSRITSAAREIAFDVRTGFEEFDIRIEIETLLGGKWRLRVAAAVLLVLAALGATQWKLNRNHTSNSSVQASERRVRDLTPSTPENKGYDQSGMSAEVLNSAMNITKGLPAADAKIAAQKVTVSSAFAQGLLVHQVKPLYPLRARQAGIQGTVILHAVIGKDGTVQDVRAVLGHPMLTPAAVDAVKQWRYKPYFLNGEPVEAETQISVTFTGE